MLKALYDSFYKRPQMPELKAEIEANHRLLIERLDGPERKLVLRIIDGKDMMASEFSLDSFICGFKLAWELTNELHHHEESERSTPEETAGLSARTLSASDKKK